MRHEPRRSYHTYSPLADRFAIDPHAPDADHHQDHIDRVIRASRGRGFPVAPAPRQWP